MHVSSVSIYPLHKFNIEPTKGHIHYSQIIIFSAPFSGSMLNQGYVCKVNPSWAANFKTVAMHFLRSKQRWVIIHFETRPCAISYCWRHSIPFRPRENAGFVGPFRHPFLGKMHFFSWSSPHCIWWNPKFSRLFSLFSHKIRTTVPNVHRPQEMRLGRKFFPLDN